MSYTQRETPVSSSLIVSSTIINMRQVLAELCTFLVEDMYGELASVSRPPEPTKLSQPSRVPCAARIRHHSD